jgi:hypothetical protein
VYVKTVSDENVEVQFCMIVLSGTYLRKKNIYNPALEVAQGNKPYRLLVAKDALSNLSARVQRVVQCDVLQ